MLRIYYARPRPPGEPTVGEAHNTQEWETLCGQASELGFDTLLTPQLDAADAAAAICRRHKLGYMMDVVLDRVPARGLLAREHADWYDDAIAPVLDPRRTTNTDVLRIRRSGGRAPPALIEYWGSRLLDWANAGVAGFRCLFPAGLAGEEWRALIAHVHAHQPDCGFLAWTPGLSPDQLRRLSGAGFEASFLSLPWWDYRSSWLVEEHDRLRALGHIISPVADPDEPMRDIAGQRVAEMTQDRRRLRAAAFAGNGVLMPMGFEDTVGKAAIIEMNRVIALRPGRQERVQLLTGPLADITALFRRGSSAAMLLINPDSAAPAKIDWPALYGRLPDSYTLGDAARQDLPAVIPPASSSIFAAVPAVSVKPLGNSSGEQRKSIAAALRAPRIAIENVAPAVDQGRFPVKRALGESVQVEADVFMDGHDAIAVGLLWRAIDEAKWHHLPMEHQGNDRWRATFRPDKLGRHAFSIRAWLDVWRTYCDALQKKVAANQDVSLDVEEGRALLASAMERARDDMPGPANIIATSLNDIGTPQAATTRPRHRRMRSAASAQTASAAAEIPRSETHQVDVLLSPELQQAMRAVDSHPFETSDMTLYPVSVERREAGFASWYELFPRSQGPEPGVHGTLVDVIDRLPAIQEMGFDVLYFPPIHPIGMRNRKGKNNALVAGAEDPGSPYAIGSPDGGHDALHPDLGSLDDFRRLIRAAREHDLEIAMDFAIQCSPDHPWLAEHPDWFDWRADGSLRYAENPPKRYEDIVNPDFYSPSASAPQQAALWRALRDVILFWIDQGVQTFRVDNPHTKPLPFWQWMIAEVQSVHPAAIFLSEAFTRPKMMYRLAKIGFSQSYTYFTWRNTKQELTEYLEELTAPPAVEFFRPNFFVNTPDINPYFLQTSGRPGFLIRAALATTTSGLWGMYNGFELCEGTPMPGKEEYLDSEKYQLRWWDWNRPGNIVAEITQLNRIRRGNPAFQSHRGIEFHHVDNDQILFFSKETDNADSVVLVIISLDPLNPQAGTLDVPFWKWDLPDNATVPVQELFQDYRFSLQGRYQPVRLTPEQPFLIWRLLRHS
ncbi:MAG TPA: alpha-1,4-glucan--maltose-1-phosphate maltosyltransferase [Candidimonas sp.]|nr:alpha-1,4-glucan--maltose-1-phosphate maltosyltransferase [Candidimonas sp.]